MKLAIDLGGTTIRIGLVDGDQVIKKLVKPCPATLSCDDSLQYIIRLIEEIIHPGIDGIGIGVPSVVDASAGIVYNVMNIPSWIEVPLKEIFEKKFGIPVFVNNDANCFALGEKIFGEGIPFHNMVGVTLGTGVGSGIIIKGEIYNGTNTGAGEIGCLPYLSYDFEHYCSSNYFVRYYNITGKEAGEKAKKGDEVALKIWEEFGTHFGNLVKAILFTYDPEAIVIGGGIADAYSFFEKAAKETMQSFPYAGIVEKLHIRVSQKENISLLGASALIK